MTEADKAREAKIRLARKKLQQFQRKKQSESVTNSQEDLSPNTVEIKKHEPPHHLESLDTLGSNASLTSVSDVPINGLTVSAPPLHSMTPGIPQEMNPQEDSDSLIQNQGASSEEVVQPPKSQRSMVQGFLHAFQTMVTEQTGKQPIEQNTTDMQDDMGSLQTLSSDMPPVDYPFTSQAPVQASVPLFPPTPLPPVPMFNPSHASPAQIPFSNLPSATSLFGSPKRSDPFSSPGFQQPVIPISTHIPPPPSMAPIGMSAIRKQDSGSQPRAPAAAVPPSLFARKPSASTSPTLSLASPTSRQPDPFELGNRSPVSHQDLFQVDTISMVQRAPGEVKKSHVHSFDQSFVSKDPAVFEQYVHSHHGRASQTSPQVDLNMDAQTSPHRFYGQDAQTSPQPRMLLDSQTSPHYATKPSTWAQQTQTSPTRQSERQMPPYVPSSGFENAHTSPIHPIQSNATTSPHLFASPRHAATSPISYLYAHQSTQAQLSPSDHASVESLSLELGKVRDQLIQSQQENRSLLIDITNKSERMEQIIQERIQAEELLATFMTKYSQSSADVETMREKIKMLDLREATLQNRETILASRERAFELRQQQSTPANANQDLLLQIEQLQRQLAFLDEETNQRMRDFESALNEDRLALLSEKEVFEREKKQVLHEKEAKWGKDAIQREAAILEKEKRLQAQQNSLNQEKAALESRIHDINQYQQSLHLEKQTLDERIQQMNESHLHHFSGTSEEISAERAQLEQAIRELQDEKKEFEAQKQAQMQSMMNEYKDRMSKLSEDFAWIEKEREEVKQARIAVDALKKQSQAVEIDSKIQVELNRLKQENESLSRRLGDMQKSSDQILELEKNNKELQAELVRLTDALHMERHHHLTAKARASSALSHHDVTDSRPHELTYSSPQLPSHIPASPQLSASSVKSRTSLLDHKFRSHFGANAQTIHNRFSVRDSQLPHLMNGVDTKHADKEGIRAYFNDEDLAEFSETTRRILFGDDTI